MNDHRYGEQQRMLPTEFDKNKQSIEMNLILLEQSQRMITDKEDDDDAKTGEKYNDHGGMFVLPPQEKQAKHIIHHLKKTISSRVRIGLIPGGPIGEAVITALPGDGSVHLTVDATTLRPPPAKPLVRIMLGIPYPKTILALFPVLTSLGVDHIVFARASLTEPGFLETSKLQRVVYEPLLREGLSQAEDTQPPKVSVVPKDKFVHDLLLQDQEATLDAWTADCCKIVLHIPQGETSAFQSIRACFQKSIAAEASSSCKGIFLAIGPERGWTDQEAKAFDKAGFLFASLGDPILRTDTAVIAAVALARDVLLESAHLNKQKEAASIKRKIDSL